MQNFGKNDGYMEHHPYPCVFFWGVEPLVPGFFVLNMIFRTILLDCCSCCSTYIYHCGNSWIWGGEMGMIMHGSFTQLFGSVWCKLFRLNHMRNWRRWGVTTWNTPNLDINRSQKARFGPWHSKIISTDTEHPQMRYRSTYLPDNKMWPQPWHALISYVLVWYNKIHARLQSGSFCVFG